MDTEYSDERLDEILTQITEWGVEFSESEYFEELTEHQQRESEYIVTTIAELLYGYELLAPEDWDEHHIEQCCTQLYPRKVTADDDHFRAVAPVLEAFLTFLDDRSYLDNGAALADHVGGLGDEIVRQAENPANWGMAKSMFMDAVEDAGMDVDDVESTEQIEALLEASGAEQLELMTDEEEPTMVSMDREQRFLELYGHLLVYVNDRFDVLDGVETYADIEDRDTQELLALRNRLYEEDTEALIEAFVADNPAGYGEPELAQIEQWTDYEFGEFMVVRHLEDYAVFLDWEDPPRAFGVKAVRFPFSALWSEDALPILVSEVALLPFEGEIVTDGWLATDPISSMAMEMTMDPGVDDAYEEAKHRFGIIESLPPPEEETKSDAEQLRFYMKNKRNRERYAEEIEELRGKTEELERIYHEELGKARARSLGRELRDLGLEEAYVAIYDEQVIASAGTKHGVQDVLTEIMPEGTEDHPYIYHYDP